MWVLCPRDYALFLNSATQKKLWKIKKNILCMSLFFFLFFLLRCGRGNSKVLNTKVPVENYYQESLSIISLFFIKSLLHIIKKLCKHKNIKT